MYCNSLIFDVIFSILMLHLQTAVHVSNVEFDHRIFDVKMTNYTYIEINSTYCIFRDKCILRIKHLKN